MSDTTATLKVLASGDVDGRFAAFLKRLETVERKSGPFEMVLCVGSFFGAAGDDGDAAVWKALLAGERRVPMPVYLLGPNNQEEVGRFSDLKGYELCENVVYLGEHGCFTTKEGMTIAYLSGRQQDSGGGAKKDYEFGYDQVKSMEVKMKSDDTKFQGVDVLITSDWPHGVSNFSSRPAGLPAEAGSKLISKVALQLRPRYHFSGVCGIHYERQPYRNHRVAQEPARHVTRFIGLGKVGNSDKRKWLYAFNISPLKGMERAALVAQPTEVTDVPYNAAAYSAGADDSRGGGSFFWDMNAGPEDPNKRRKGQRVVEEHQQQKRPRQQPAGPCWFCLSGSEVEKHLIVSIGDHSYLALPKGGLTPDHVLVLPIAHHPSLLELPKEVEEEIDKFKSALKKCYKKQGKAAVFFERNYKSHHLQLQVVPVKKECAEAAKTAFNDVGDAQDVELLEMIEHSTLPQMVQPGAPYFYAELPCKTRLFHRVRSGFPIQFGREALACKALLDMEDRIDWRDCKVGKEEETKMTKDFRSAFQPFDFTLEDDDK